AGYPSLTVTGACPLPPSLLVWRFGPLDHRPTEGLRRRTCGAKPTAVVILPQRATQRYDGQPREPAGTANLEGLDSLDMQLNSLTMVRRFPSRGFVQVVRRWRLSAALLLGLAACTTPTDPAPPAGVQIQPEDPVLV